MINLLPDETKRQIRAGHTNVILLNYIIVLIIAVVFLVGIVIGVYVLLTNTKTAAEAQISSNTSRASVYSTATAQALQLRAGLASAKTILNQEVDYSKIIIGIAQVLPSGVVLGGLNLSSTTIGTPIVLQAYAKTTSDALALKQAFQSSPLLSSVSIQSLSIGNSSSGDYPVNISVGVTINKAAAR